MEEKRRFKDIRRVGGIFVATTPMSGTTAWAITKGYGGFRRAAPPRIIFVEMVFGELMSNRAPQPFQCVAGQFASARVLAALPCLPATLSCESAFPFAPQPLR